MNKPKTLTVKKPWGMFWQFTHNQKTTVKIIEVNKGGVLSLQSHENRDELWAALDNGLVFEKSGKKQKAGQGKAFFVPRKTRHRVLAAKKARFLEISFGDFDEGDIKRFEDKYGRANTKKR